MPQKKYPLYRNGPLRLKLSWKGQYRDLAVSLDNRKIGSINSPAELRSGCTFQLDQENLLFVRIVIRYWQPDLELFINGTAVPGSAADPRTGFKTSATAALCIGTFNLLAGIAATFFHAGFLLDLGVSLFSIPAGIIFILLSRYIYNEKKWAVHAVLFLFAADWGYSLWWILGNTESSPSMTANVLRMILLFGLWQGFSSGKRSTGAE